jgi:two-component system cell cycle sensor histidine kinase/response regulator CckA
MTNPFPILSLLSSGAIFSLGVFAFFQGKRERLNTVFLFLCVSEALWAFSEHAVLGAESSGAAIFWGKLGSVWPLTFALCVHFMILFAGLQRLARSRFFFLILYLPALFFFTLDFSTNLLTDEFVRQPWGWTSGVAKNPLATAAIVWAAVTAGLSLFLVTREAFKARDARRRMQARIMSAGFLCFFAGLLTIEALMPLFRIPFPRIRSFALLAKSAFIFYAIARYRLFTLTSRNVSEGIVSAISDSLILVDPDEKVHSVNRAFLDLCGYEEEEVMGRKAGDLMTVECVRERDDFTDREAFFKRKGGVRIPVSLSRSALNMKTGVPLGFIYAGRDIRERRSAQEELRLQMAYLEGLFMNAPEAVVICSNDGRIVRVNPEFGRVFGFTHDEVAGRFIDDVIVPAENLEEARALTDRSFHGSRISVEAVRKRKDGAFIDVSILGTPITAGGSQLGVYVIYRDITENKAVEKALKESERRYRLLFECAGDPIIIHGIDGKIFAANERALGRLGYTREEMLAKRLEDIIANETSGELAELARRLEREGSAVFESAGRAGDGSRIPVEVNTRLIPYTDGKAFLSIVRDLTERKNAEKALRESEERLLHSQKMEAIGRLAGGVAHDFNNLLTAISGFSEIILMKDCTSEETKKYIAEIVRSTERAASLTHQLLAFSRKQVMQPKLLDLNKLIVDVNRMLRRLIGEDIELVTAADPGLGTVKADPVQIEQVLINLAVNSRDAMPAGGKIFIETKNEQLTKEQCALNGDVAPGQYVTFSVSDTGHGMDEETRLRVFEPFFTTKEPGKGTGLGLCTVFGIVKQSGGHISVESEPGKGTTMKVYLPRVNASENQADGKRAEAGMRLGSETILVVEDEEIVRTMLCRMLRGLGYTIYEAGSVYEAMNIAEQKGEKRIDLMITDVVMPGMNGRELATLLTRLRPDTRVLYMSGYTDDAIVHHGVLDSDVHFLQKPFSPKTLAMKVREVLEKKAG